MKTARLLVLSISLTFLLSPSSAILAQETGAKQLAEKALALAEQGNLEEALTTVDLAISQNAEAVSYHTLRGRILNTLERTTEASGAFSHALWLDPAYIPARAGRAKLALQMGMLEQAEADCNVLFEADVKAFEIRGQARYQQGNYMGALADYSELIEERKNQDDNSGLNDPWYYRGRSFHELLCYDLAIEQYTIAWERNTDAIAILYRARCFVETSQYQKAVDDFDQYFKTSSTIEPFEYLERANCYFHLDDFENTKADINTAKNLDSDNPELQETARQGLQKIELRQKELADNPEQRQPSTAATFPPNQTLIDFRDQLMKLDGDQAKIDELITQTVKTAPANADEAELRAWIFGMRQEYQKALQFYNQALELDADHVPSLMSRIVLVKAMASEGDLDQQQSFDRMMADIDHLITLNHPFGYQQRAIQFQNIESLDRALSGMSTALRLSPKNPAELTFLRAEVLFDAGVYDIALTEFEKAFELGYDEPGSRVSAGILYSGAERQDKVIESFTFEIETGVQNPFFWTYRGYAYELAGQLERAVNDYEHAMSIAEPESQPHVIAKNGLNDVNNKLPFGKLLQAVQAEDVQGFRKLLSPEVAGLLDDKAIASRLSTINHQLRTSVPGQWQAFEEDEHLGLKKVTIRIKGDGNEHFVIQGHGNGLFRGLTFRSDQFHIDTYDAIAEKPELTAQAEAFWQALFSGNGEKAVEVFAAGHPDNSLPDDFTNLIKQFATGIVARDPDTTIGNIAPHQTRIMELDHENTGLAIEVFQLAEFTNDQFNPCRMVFQRQNDQWVAVSFKTGEIKGHYAHQLLDYDALLFAAFVSNDPAEFIKLAHPSDQTAIVPEVLEAFQAAMKEKYGSFTSIDERDSSATTHYEKDVRYTESRGTARFENGSFRYRLNTSYGTVDNYYLDVNLGAWPRQIKDFTKFESFGGRFLQQLVNGEPAETRSWIPDDLAVTVNELTLAKDALVARIGEVQEVVPESRSFNDQNNTWTIHYRIEGATAETTGQVAFAFSATDASIFGYDVRFPEPETPEANKIRKDGN